MSKDVGSSLPPRRPPPGTTSLPPWLRAHRWAEPLLSCPLGYLRMLSASEPGTSRMVSTPGHWSLWVGTQPRKPSFQFWVTPTTSLSELGWKQSTGGGHSAQFRFLKASNVTTSSPDRPKGLTESGRVGKWQKGR